MNREEAQFILQAYRASGDDAHDPQFKEPLALVRLDPELARWFAAEQAMDRALGAKIRAAIPAIPGLKDQLLHARTTGYGVPWWRKPVFLATAASVALLLSFGGAWRWRQKAGDANFSAFRTATAQAALDMSQHLEVIGLDDTQLRQWLAGHRGDPDFVLPPKLAATGIMGCKVMEWRGRNVTLLCFKVGGKHVDVFVVDASALRGLAPGRAPLFATTQGLTAATWSRDGKIYHLAGNLSKSELEQLL
ncbi:MAG: hypothetical protein ABIZ81_15965 [Opitutaceae bacterium]